MPTAFLPVLSPRLPKASFKTSPCISPRRRPYCCVESVDPGETLVQAAMSGNLPLVQSTLPLTSASYTSTRNASGMTALMWACSEGYLEIVKTLLAAHAQPNARSATGHTALLFAFENVPRKTMRPLPGGFPGRKGNQPKQLYLTPRTTAHEQVARLLIAAGADVTVVNEAEESLLHLAARKGAAEWIDVLVPPLHVNQVSKGYRQTPLHIAALESHVDVVKRLIEKGAVVDATGAYGWTPLVCACACASGEVVKELIQAGADVNWMTETGEGVESTTPLKEAKRGRMPVSIVRMLREAGARE